MVTGAPFERLHVDLTGPRPKSRRGSVFIVTCVDPFTKWAEASASYDDYASEMDDRLRLAYILVREHLHVDAERNKRYYDLRVRSQRYKEGDWVYYYNPRKYAGRQDKWRRKFSGPFLVTQIVGPVYVMLQRIKRHRSFCVHIDEIKPYEAEIMPKSWLNADAFDDQQMMSAERQPKRSVRRHR